MFFTILIPSALNPFDFNEFFIFSVSSFNIGINATAMLIIIPISFVFTLNIFNGNNTFSIEVANLLAVKFFVKVYVILHTSTNLIAINIALYPDTKIALITKIIHIKGNNLIILFIDYHMLIFSIIIRIIFIIVTTINNL